MARFYDFLFYVIYKFYSGKEKGAASSSAGIIGGLQAINVLTTLMLGAFIVFPKEYFNSIIVIVVFVFFQVTTYIRYIYKEKNSAKKLEERWLKMNEAQKKRIRVLGLVYIFSSIFIFVGLAIYVGVRR